MTDPTPDVPTLRRLLAEATTGPWEADDVDGDIWGPGNRERVCRTSAYAYGPDAALIAAAVNALPGLLDRLEAAEGAVARCAELADEWADRAGEPPRYFANITRVEHATALRAALAEVTP